MSPLVCLSDGSHHPRTKPSFGSKQPVDRNVRLKIHDLLLDWDWNGPCIASGNRIVRYCLKNEPGRTKESDQSSTSSFPWTDLWHDFRQSFFPQGNATWANVYFKTPVAVGRPCWTSCHRCFGVICRINSYKCTMRAMQYQQKRHIPLLRSVWNICRYTTAARFVNIRIFELQNFFTIVKQVELTKVCSCSTKEVVSGGDVGGSNFIDS